MSARHPIIAITGSSGAGTTSVTRTFENVFRRENLNAAIIEGDSFHRHDRKAMKIKAAEAEAAGNKNFSHFGPENNLFRSSKPCFVITPTPAKASAANTCTIPKRPPLTSKILAPSPPGKTCPPTPTCCFTKVCTVR